MVELAEEKERQEQFPWQRGKFHTAYNAILAHYKVLSCIENSPRAGSLLDLACGDGMMTEMFSHHFDRVVGVDASSQHVAEARKRLPDGEFHECLIEDFKTDEKFDSIFLLDILEHLVDPVSVLKKVSTWLAPDGVIIAHVPNAMAINRRLNVLMGSLTECHEMSPFDINIAGHRRTYELSTLEEHFKEADLDVKKTGGIFYKIMSTPQIDWFLKNGLWEEGGHGWGRTGMEKDKDWRAEFCRASYELGKEHPGDCNIIYACGSLKK